MPSPEECEKLGKELLAWAKGGGTKKDPRTTFAQWYSLVKMMPRKNWKALVSSPEFSPYYESAQAILARRCMDGTMEKSFGQRYIRLYDRELVEAENEKATADAQARAQALVQETQALQIMTVNYSGNASKDKTDNSTL
jgi:hypothetical protein